MNRPLRLLALVAVCTVAAAATPSLAMPLGTRTPSVADEVLTRTLRAPAGDWFLSGAIRGTPSRMVQAGVGDRLSAPIRLDGSWQRFGISGHADDAGSLTLVLRSIDDTSAAPAVELADLTLAAVGPTWMRVEPGTRMVTRNGKPWIAKGFNYLPLPIGEVPWVTGSTDDVASCQQDARLMGGAGVTSLRVHMQDHMLTRVEQSLQCIDAFAANGVGIAWLVYGPGEVTSATTLEAIDVEAYWLKLAELIELYGSHPATELFILGNEIEHQSGNRENARRWFGQAGGAVGWVDDLARRTREAAPHTLVGVSASNYIPLIMPDVNVPSLDFWGLNTYGSPGVTFTEGSWLRQHLEAWDDRPFLITEWGSDRLRCIRDAESYLNEEIATAIGATPAFRTRVCAPGSGDDAASHTAQADFNGRLWDDLSAYLATPDNPDGHWFGGQYFMWTDLWWFSLGGQLDFLDTPATHGTNGLGYWGGSFDSVFNSEFLGAGYAQLSTQTEPRVTTIGLDALARRWSGAGPAACAHAIGARAAHADGCRPPDLEGATASVEPSTPVGCVATVSWITSEPATSELQVAVNGETFEGGGLASDETIFFLQAYDDELRTVHSLAVDLAPNAKAYRLAPRSWTADGRHATTPPLHVTCPST